MATRVRARRHKGEIVEPFDVYVGRRCTRGGWDLPHSKWHNPFKLSDGATVEDVLARYRAHIVTSGLIADIEELRGKRLACFCDRGRPCHVDVLISLLEGK